MGLISFAYPLPLIFLFYPFNSFFCWISFVFPLCILQPDLPFVSAMFPAVFLAAVSLSGAFSNFTLIPVMVLFFPSVFFLSSARSHITSPSVASWCLSGVLAFLICALLSSSQLLHQGFLIWGRKFPHKFHLPWGNIFLVLVCHLFFSCVSVDLLIVFFFLIFQLCNMSFSLMRYLQKFTLRQTGTFLMLQSVVCMFVFLKSMGFSSYEGFLRQGYFSPPLTGIDYFLQIWLISMVFFSWPHFFSVFNWNYVQGCSYCQPMHPVSTASYKVFSVPH